MSTNSSVATESPIPSNAASDVSSDTPLVVLVVGGSVDGLSTALALASIGCEVHIYEQSDGLCPSSETGVPLTEELKAFLTAHGVELVSVSLPFADCVIRPQVA